MNRAIRFMDDDEVFNRFRPTIDGDTLVVYQGRLVGYRVFLCLNDPDLLAMYVQRAEVDTKLGRWVFYKGNKEMDIHDLEMVDRLRILHAYLGSPNAHEIPRPSRHPEEYRRVETDQSGNIIGYKVLSGRGQVLYSPLRGTAWREKQLKSDLVPTADGPFGIYCAKTPDSPALDEYRRLGKLYSLILSGVVVEAEFGYRAESARILFAWDLPPIQTLGECILWGRGL